VFENIIEQSAVLQLCDDIKNAKNAPSMLFFGPLYSGKASAALELARVLSCEKPRMEQRAVWKCSCSSCERHRLLAHEDLLVLGKRSFASEIEACKHAFLRNPSNQNAKLLFFRSIRKLMIRFSPALMEDDPKFSKISSTLHSLDEKLNDFWDIIKTDESSAEKINAGNLDEKCASLIKDSLSLENEGISANIPIGHIRSASYWCRLAPNGKQKTLIIENAENMRDEARNSLLKLLEEPPLTLNIVLTTQRKEVIIPTILSRLRPYRFLKRSQEGEKEIIRRVFQESNLPDTGEQSLNAYLDSFIPQSTEKMYPLAAWFIVSIAHEVSLKKASDVPLFVNTLGGRYAPAAQAAGFGRCLKSNELIKTILTKNDNFKDASFSRFMKICMDMICDVLRSSQNPDCIKYGDFLRKYINETAASVDVYNISESSALEALYYNLKKVFSGRMSLRGLYG